MVKGTFLGDGDAVIGSGNGIDARLTATAYVLLENYGVPTSGENNGDSPVCPRICRRPRICRSRICPSLLNGPMPVVGLAAEEHPDETLVFPIRLPVRTLGLETTMVASSRSRDLLCIIPSGRNTYCDCRGLAVAGCGLEL
jgi:hypothetical protein